MRERDVVLAAVLPTIVLGLVALLPGVLYVQIDIPAYLVLHTLLELASIVVSFAIFAVNWQAYRQRANARSLLIGVAFLTVAIFDTMHTISYDGMPDFVTANSVGKAIVYWLGARLTEACAVLLAAFIAADARHPLLRRAPLLAASMAIAAAAFGLTTYFWAYLPPMYVPGQGLTPLKVSLEYAVIAINLVAIVAYWRGAQARADTAGRALLPALMVVIFAELSFTLYASAYDTYNLVGHLFKVAAYYLIFRALFQTSVEHPYHELRRRHEELAALSRTAVDVAASLDITTVSDSVLGHCLRLTGAELGFLGLLNPAGDLDVVAVRGVDQSPCPLKSDGPMAMRLGELWAASILKGSTVRVPAVSADPRSTGIPDGHPELHAFLGVPLLVKGRTVGLVALANRPGGFSAADEDLVSAFASQTAVAIENARLYAAERRLAELERNKVRELYQVNRALNSSLGLPDTLLAVANSARDLLQAEVVAVLLGDDATVGHVRIVALAGVTLAEAGSPLPISGTLAAEVLASGTPQFVDDLEVRPAASALRLDTARARALLAVPLRVRGKLGGVIEIYSREPRRYSPDDVALVASFADAAAVAVANAEMYEQVRTEDERLRELDRLKDEFISIASHELKNPLSSILGYAQLALRKVSPGNASDPAVKPWRAVLRQAERLGRLVDQLLDVSRIQMGRLELNRQPVDLGALARQVLEHLQVTTEQHRLVLEVPDTPVIGRWDAGLLEQVLSNLVGNAIKYSPAGGTVTVQVAAEPAQLMEQHVATTPRVGTEQHRPAPVVAQCWAIVRVADRGIGIPKERQQQLFQRFSRAHSTTRYKVSGLGLGLYISHEIVAQHGGRMWVVSEEGRGSDFYFSLPID